MDGKGASKAALAVVELQAKLPQARIMFDVVFFMLW
jgi:NhaP-type Na+/H+ and K+/H+ antiporter